MILSKRKAKYGSNPESILGHPPIKFYPFPWKVSFEGIVDGYGENVINCKQELAKIIVEAVNKRNMHISKWRTMDSVGRSSRQINWVYSPPRPPLQEQLLRRSECATVTKVKGGLSIFSFRLVQECFQARTPKTLSLLPPHPPRFVRGVGRRFFKAAVASKMRIAGMGEETK